KGMNFRPNGPSPNISALARTIDCTIWAGEADGTKVTGTFATNWTSKPVVVFPAGRINAPSWVRVGAPPPPLPFSFKIPYKTPLGYTGRQDLTWEVVITATSQSGGYFADALSAGSPNNGAYSMIGKGCTASDQTRTMDLRCYFSTYADKRVRHYCYCYGSYRDQPAVALMGFRNPNTALPLCAATPTMRLYTDAIFSFPSQYAGKSRASDGYWNTGLTRYFNYIASMDKIPIFHQGASLDPKAPTGVTLSNGVSSAIKPPLPPPPPIWRIFANGLPNATSGTLVKGYALVTEFTQ
ncbi:MAG: hypothetical protein QF412_12025, partial [Planctomycetota bacterium]|nr:hypothetical protein [Planctomycetota bacterium]